MEQIPHSKPWITRRDIDAVSSTVESLMIAQGRKTQALEEQLASWFKALGGVAVGSGSAAIVVALHGVGVSAGSEVILPTYVCRSVLEAVLEVNAKPVLCDVGPDWVVVRENVEHLVSPRTSAIVIPHMYGVFADVAAFVPLGIPIIEDCAQALGGNGARPIQADVTVLSFHPTKCITSGEGGIAITADPKILRRMRDYRDGTRATYSGRFFSPLSDIGASLVLSQLDRYDQALQLRKEVATRYTNVLEQYFPLALNRQAFKHSMFFRFPIRLSGGLDSCQKLFDKKTIQVRRGVDFLLHRGLNLPDATFSASVDHFNTTVSIPIYPALSMEDESRCIDAMAQILRSVYP